jgi:hypothetical protein
MRKSIFYALSLALCLSSFAFAQGFNGSIVGRVQDQQSAVVPNATVLLKNDATGVERKTTTDNEGDYNFLAIQPGRYTVRVEAKGFANAAVPVEVSVASTLRADIKLNVAGAAEVVNVSAIGEGGVSVQTEAATLGNLVSQRQVVELPTITRNPYDLVALTAGATQSSDGRGAGFSINGQRAASGNFVLDGGENNDTFVAGVGQQVPLDAVQEFRLQTNNYNAEYGRNAGFVANVVTKSGSNAMHGSVYWFLRNSALAANTFDNNANGSPRPVFNRNQFGGAVGGHIIKDKLFYFGSFEPIIVRSSAPTRYFVPTPAFLALTAPGTQEIFKRYPVPSGLSTTDVVTRAICPFGRTCTGTTNTVTLPIFARVTRTGPRDAGAGVPQDTYLATGRVDYNMSEKTQIFGRYAFEDSNQFATVRNAYTADLDQPFLARNNNILLNMTRTWSSNFVTESRVVYNRIRYGNPLVPGPNGFPNFFISTENVNLPRGASSFGGPQNLYQFFQTANWNKGSHNIKFGGQYIHMRDNRTFGAFETADASFANLAAFIAGNISRYTIAIDPKGAFPGQNVAPPFGPPSFTRHFRYNEPGFFIQDTWKVKSNITLTPGLRYEYFGVLHSPKNERQLDSNFYYGTGANILERIANGRYIRTQDAPGDLKNRFYKPDYNDFSPRLGLAWDVFGNGKTAFRSGIGIFYDRNFGNVVFNVIQNPPNYGTTFVTNVPVTAQLVANQYAAFPNATRALSGSSARHLDENLRTAYTVSWNATLEHELLNKMVVSATYVGSNGVKLYSLNNINRFDSGRLLPASFGRTAGQRLNLGASSINTRGNLGNSNYQSLQLSANSRYISSLGLQFGANYTWSHSIDNNSSFFGDDASANPIGFGFLNPFDTSLDRGPSDFDARHRFAANFNWEIPFGKDSKNFVGKYLIGGWQMTGFLSFQTGQPFSIFDSALFDYTGADFGRPLLTGALPATISGRSRPDNSVPNTFLWLPLGGPFYNDDFECIGNRLSPIACDPNASVNGPYRGNLPRNTFRRPGNQFHNLSFMKNIPIREGMKLQWRGEFYNVFNHQNAYLNAGSNDVAFPGFNGNSIPGVTINYGTRASQVNGNPAFDARQIVMALKLIF